MSDIFKNYPQPDDYTPDNRNCKCSCDERDTVVAGGTTTHAFILNFSFSELCDSFDVTYKSGLDDFLVISSSNLGAPYKIDESDGKTTIAITLSPDDTKMFARSRDAFAQMKLYMKDGSVIFGELNKLIVKDTLSADLAA